MANMIRRIGIPILLVLSFLGSFVLSAQAETADEVRQKIETKNNDIAALEKEIAGYQSQLLDLGKQKGSLTNSIKELDLNAKKFALDIKVTQTKINATTLSIQQLSLDIGSTSDSIGINQHALSRLIRIQHEIDNTPFVETLATDFTLGSVWRTIDATNTIQGKLNTHVSTLKGTKDTLEKNKTTVEVAKDQLVSLQKQLADQKKVIDQNTRDKQKLLKDTRNKESNYTTILKDKLARKAAFEKELSDFESQLQFILDPSSFASAKKGTFSWPLDYVHITQFFGKTVAAARLYVSGTHSGVDFGTPVGSIVRAVGTGTVIGTGNTDLTCPGASYGNWVFIKYDNGLATTYGHLSLIATSAGTRVKSGDIVAYSGNTGYSTGPHVHVSVFVSAGVSIQTFASKSCGGKIYTMPVAAKNAYLDPMLYFPAYTGPINVGSQTH